MKKTLMPLLLFISALSFAGEKEFVTIKFESSENKTEKILNVLQKYNVSKKEVSEIVGLENRQKVTAMIEKENDNYIVTFSE